MIPYKQTDAYVPLSILKRQEHQRIKLAKDFKNRSLFSEIKIDVEAVNKPVAKPVAKKLLPVIEEKPAMILDSEAYLPLFVMQRQKFLTGSKPEYKIGQEYLADCGLDAHWVYKCAPWKNPPICLENESDGAWVPFIILYRVDYFECKFVKEQDRGREFSRDHGEAYN